MNYEPSTSQCCRFMEMDALKDAGKIKCYKSHVERSANSGGSSWAIITPRFYGYRSLSLLGWGGRKALCTKNPGSTTDQKNLLVRKLSHVLKGPERRLIRRRNSNHTDSYLLGECYSFIVMHEAMHTVSSTPKWRC